MYVTMTSSQMYNFVIVYTFEMIFCFEKNFLGSQYIPNKYLFVHTRYVPNAISRNFIFKNAWTGHPRHA